MQSSFSEFEYPRKKKITRRDRFVAEIEAVTPASDALVATIEAFYPKDEGRGRPSIDLARMLRIYVAQQCFGLSDEGTEDAIYDSEAIRRFVGIDLSREAAPDATTPLKFRRLLEEHGLTRQIFKAINAHLVARGLLTREGRIIAAPSSTRNSTGRRDPEMHQAKKGNQWHFGMKAHVSVDADSGLVHTMVATPANAHDVTQAHEQVHGKESDVFTDSGYRGVHKREKVTACHPNVHWHVAQMPGRRWALDKARARRTDRRAGVHEGAHPGEGRTCVSRSQKPVQASQGALPQAGEEHGAAAGALRAGQSDVGPQALIGT